MSEQRLLARSAPVVPHLERLVRRARDEARRPRCECERSDGVLRLSDSQPELLASPLGKRTHLVQPSAPQLERVRLPGAHSPVGPDADENRNARGARDRHLGERSSLDARSVLVAGHLSEYGTRDKVDRAKAALCAAADRDRAVGVHGNARNSAVEPEPRVGWQELVYRLTRAWVPEDQDPVLGAGDNLLACARSLMRLSPG